MTLQMQRPQFDREPFAQCSRLLARMDRMHANAGLGEAEQHYRGLLAMALRHEKLDHAMQAAAGMARLQAVKPNFDVEAWRWLADGARADGELDILGGDRLAITADSEATDRWQELVSRIEQVRHAGAAAG